jgi:ubiquitin carboxyl-terminal hydrolase 7
MYESYSDSDQSYNADIHSPSNDMVVDTDDLLNDADAEKDDGDIAIINPEDEATPRADDCIMTRRSELQTLAD